MTDDEAHVRDMYLPFRERSWRPSCSLSKGAGRSEKVFCRASRWRPGVAHSGRTRPSTECRCTERHPGSTLSSSDTRMMDDEMMDDLRTVNRGAHKALTHRRARPARRSSGPCGAACERQGTVPCPQLPYHSAYLRSQKPYPSLLAAAAVARRQMIEQKRSKRFFARSVCDQIRTTSTT